MITVRSARLSDARVLSELAKQLGYPCKESYVMKGIERIAGRGDEDLLVAESRGCRTLGLNATLIRKATCYY